MAFILAIDIGTTGLKTIVTDEEGNIVDARGVEYGMLQKAEGSAEQSPRVWWEAVIKSFQEILDPERKKQIYAIGVSGQFQSLIMLDQSFAPLYNAILWCDHRGEEMLPEISKKVGADRLYEITANPALSGSTVSSLLWVRRYHPDIFEKCRHIMLPHEYIRFRLTGECMTDVTSASSMQLLNVPKRQWAGELFSALDLDRSIVAPLCECIETVGRTTQEIQELTGIPKGIPVIAGGGDSVVSAIGTGVIREGSCFTSIGTSGIICTNTKNIKSDPAGRVNTYCSAVPGMWSVITCSITSGFALKWLKENFCTAEQIEARKTGRDVYDLLNEEAEKAGLGAGGLMFLPYLMGDRTPHLNSDAKGGFLGITSNHGRRHFVRAVMEGAAYSLLEGIQVMRELGIELDDYVLCGGGAKGKIWREIIADIYGNLVTTVQNDSGSAIGAAVLAACGSGMYAHLEEAVSQMIKRKKADTYCTAHHKRYMEYFRLYQEIYRRLEDLFPKFI